MLIAGLALIGEISDQADAGAERFTGLLTAPERIQRVQTFICLLLLSLVATLIFCKFGNQRRLVLLWA